MPNYIKKETKQKCMMHLKEHAGRYKRLKFEHNTSVSKHETRDKI